MTATAQLWLARHAQPLVAQGLCYGALDLHADPAATAHSARQLADALPQALQVRHSPLQRCAQLAHALQALRPDLQVQPDARLGELDFGTWEGRAWNDIARADMDAWTAAFATHRPGGGEAWQPCWRAWQRPCKMPVNTPCTAVAMCCGSATLAWRAACSGCCKRQRAACRAPTSGRLQHRRSGTGHVVRCRCRTQSTSRQNSKGEPHNHRAATARKRSQKIQGFCGICSVNAAGPLRLAPSCTWRGPSDCNTRPASTVAPTR